MDNNAMFKISYGLFVLSAREGDKDNGCIINTAEQVTVTPNRVTVAVNKLNYTHDMIARTGQFNVSVLDVTAPFSVFRQFGFQSGRTVDKWQGLPAERTPNGLLYLRDNTAAFLSGKVVDTLDLGTHTMFLADVTEAEILSAADPVTYTYYQNNIKPKPQPTNKKGFRCKICGYVYEGETLPPDFICPWCKHGAADFEPIV